jgi:LacI family transcriptional regulator
MKRVSIHDVAREAGVSITTISKALNNYPDVNPQTKRRIQEVVERLNYVPDAAGRSMGGIPEKVIGLLINDLKPLDPSGAVYGILSGVCHACQDRGIGFMLLTTDFAAQRTVPLKKLCLSKGLTGLVCSGFRLDDSYPAQLRDIDIPCAFIDVETGAPGVIDVTMDNERAAQEAVAFLLKNGRRNVALVNGMRTADVAVRRGRGYRRALENANLPVLPERMLAADFDEGLAHEQARRLLARDKAVDAVFCASDLMALGVCRAAEELGMEIGRDLAVIGFDDIPVARYLYGGLTTVRQDFYLMGYTAGCAVDDRINGRADSLVTGDMMYELVVRGSAPGRL